MTAQSQPQQPKVMRQAHLYFIAYTYTMPQSKEEVARGILPLEHTGSTSLWSIDKLDTWERIIETQEWIRHDQQLRSVVIINTNWLCTGEHEFDA